MSETLKPEDGWTEVDWKHVAVGTRLAAIAPRIRWTPTLVGHFIGSLERAGYVIVEKTSPPPQGKSDGI